MRFFRRSLIALGVAATLPTLLFAAIAIFYFLRTERTQIENATLGRSFNIVTLSDAALRGDLGALNVLAVSSYFETQDWRTFYPRVQRILKANPQWVTIRLFDLEKGEEIFETFIRVASGEKSKSEALGLGNEEFVPWMLGAQM